VSPEQASRRAELKQAIAAFMQACAESDAGADPRASEGEAALARSDHAPARDALLLELARYQMTYVEPYANFAAQRLRGRAPTHADDVPALPTDAFRFARISSRPEGDDLRCFRSSGTTQDARSRHAFADLSLYDLGARLAARHALFPDLARMQLLLLVPTEEELPESSLGYMLARFVEWFGAEGSRWIWPVSSVEARGPAREQNDDGLGQLDRALRAAERDGRPLALLGTSFAFVHALDALAGARYRLPPKSRVMQTGGFKGRSREVAPDAMRAWLSESFGVAEPWIVAEYGMTELSSQLYETTLREVALTQQAGPRRLWAPGFVRVSLIEPESQRPLSGDAEGLVRVDDLANLDSVAAIQTADVGRRDAHGLTLLGRARGAVARGCSITADELLAQHPDAARDATEPGARADPRASTERP
jgi:hypothetical protein